MILISEMRLSLGRGFLTVQRAEPRFPPTYSYKSNAWTEVAGKQINLKLIGNLLGQLVAMPTPTHRYSPPSLAARNRHRPSCKQK